MVSMYTFGNQRRQWRDIRMEQGMARGRAAAASDAIVGESSSLKSVMQEVSLVAPTDATVLISG